MDLFKIAIFYWHVIKHVLIRLNSNEKQSVKKFSNENFCLASYGILLIKYQVPGGIFLVFFLLAVSLRKAGGHKDSNEQGTKNGNTCSHLISPITSLIVLRVFSENEPVQPTIIGIKKGSEMSAIKNK